MKTFSVILVCLLFSFAALAQKLNVDLYAGAANYLGDLQDKDYTFDQAHFAGGAGLTYDLTDKFSIRGGVMFSRLSADDKFGRNKDRNLNFTTNIVEGHLGLLYYITRLQDHALTPYVFGGVALFHINPYTFDTTGKKFYLQPLNTEGQGFTTGVSEYKLTNFAIPFGGGVKLSLSENLNVGLELGFRKTFSDYLDDVSSDYVDQASLFANRGADAADLAFRGDELKNGATYPAAGTARGSAKNKDMYYFTTLTASYRLGNLFGGGGGRSKKYGCPVAF